MKNLDPSKNYIFETGPLQIVYVEKYSGIRQANIYFEKYLKALKLFKPTIIFIDTKPYISFKRRKNKYLDRIKTHGLSKESKIIIQEYRDKIFDLYPLWRKWLDKFSCQKIIIKNSYKSKEEMLKIISDVFVNIVV
jgi:hypothetical protein